LWVQMLGRGTRPFFALGFDLSTIVGRLAAIAASVKHNCLCLDFAGNIKRLGPINDPVIPRKKGEKTGEVPIKECPHCKNYNHLSARYCGGEPYVTVEGCGEEFLFQTKLRQSASTEEVMKDDTPVVNVYPVDHVTYTEHHKAGKPPSVKVSYFCGLTKFTEYVHFELEGFALRKARPWWRERTQAPFPETTAQALMVVPTLSVPTHIKVWTNKAFPEILGVTFTGSFEQPIIGSEAPF
jgi:DNA repair protein RadD